MKPSPKAMSFRPAVYCLHRQRGPDAVGMVQVFGNRLTAFAAKNERSDRKVRRFLYPRRESNPDLRFRKPPFYPLNYKGLHLFYIILRESCI